MINNWRYVREKRIVMIFFLFILLFFLVFLRLSNIQVFKSSDLAQRAIRQQTREISLEVESFEDENLKVMSRGVFLDRREETLLNGTEKLRVVLFPQFTEALDQTLLSLSNVLEKNPQEIESLIKNKPVILPFDLTAAQVARLKALNLQGVVVTKVFGRYGSKPLGANLFGYLVDKDGITGLEKHYNSGLKGITSEKSLVANVNVRGELIPGLGLKEFSKVDSNRKHVVTTIDKRIQEIVETTMDTNVAEGAVVVMDVASGDILATASRPTFNPADRRAIHEKGIDVTKDRTISFRNNPPGSVFKVLVAAAAIEEGIANETTQFQCQEEYFNCTHDEVPHLTLTEALAVSCNNTFAKLALKLGKVTLIEYIKEFNLDTQTIIGYPVESSQFVTSLQIMDHTLVNAAIGQGQVELSPIQVTTLLNTIANGGIYRSPRLVDRLIDSAGKEYKHFNLSEGKQIISFDTAKMLHRMLTRVTGSNIGTGKEAYVEGYGSAGKTGTAEVTLHDKGKYLKSYNSWFSGYAPVQQPSLVVTVLVEKPKVEGAKATTVFKEIMTKSLNVEIE